MRGVRPTQTSSAGEEGMSETESGAAVVFVMFPALWVLVSFLVAHLGGWARLAREYGTTESFEGDTWRFQSGRIGVSNYGLCLTIGADSHALFMAVLFIFRVGHPPLLIPWSEVSAAETSQLFWKYVDLRCSRVPGVKVRLSSATYDRAVKAAGFAPTISARPIEPT